MKATKIVFCDKDSLSRETIKILLKKTPHTNIIGEFENTEDLLSSLDKRVPDIIIFDLHTNKLSDISGIRKILLINPDFKVIVTSTFEDTRTIAASFNSGAIAFLSKRDLSVSDLSNAIKYSIENNYYVSRCCDYKMEKISNMIQLSQLK